MLRPRGITCQGGIVHHKSPAFFNTLGSPHLKGDAGACGHWDPLFTPLLQLTRPTVEAQVPFARFSFERKCNMCLQNQAVSENGNFQPLKLTFGHEFDKKLENFVIYLFSSPHFWWKSAYKTLLLQQCIRLQATKLGNLGPNTFEVLSDRQVLHSAQRNWYIL